MMRLHIPLYDPNPIHGPRPNMLLSPPPGPQTKEPSPLQGSASSYIPHLCQDPVLALSLQNQPLPVLIQCLP